MTRRAAVLYLFPVAVPCNSALGTIPLLEPDEGRYPKIPREMLEPTDCVTPSLQNFSCGFSPKP